MNIEAKLALALVGSAIALAGCDGLGFGAADGETTEDPEQHYGALPEDTPAFVSVETDGGSRDPAPAPDLVCETSVFDAGARTAALSSAMFAVASIRSGVWPAVDLSSLDEDSFVGYFAALGGSTDSYGRFVEVGDQTVMQLLVEPMNPEEAPATRFVLVVDTSSSMRNDLAEVGAVVSQIGAAIQARPDDTLAIFEWGAKSTLFDQEVPGDHAAELAQSFSSHLDELAQAQLGPGGSLGPMKEIVGSLLDAAPPASDASQSTHVLVLTDGGVVVDGSTFGAIQSWVDRDAIVSFIEVQGDARGAPTGFHRSTLDTLALAGRGTSLFVSPSMNDTIGARFDDMLRPAYRDATLQFSSDGIFVDGQGANGSPTMLDPGWSATSRPIFFSIPVQMCAAGPVSVDVKGDGRLIGADRTIVIDGELGPKDKKLKVIDSFFQLVTEGCNAQTAGRIETLSPLVQELLGTDPADALGFGELPALLDRIAGLCG